MSYGVTEAKCACENVPAPVEPLAVIMNETSCIAADILIIARRINAHLFGAGNSDCEKEDEPRCFREELQKTRCELLATARVLADIGAQLGV